MRGLRTQENEKFNNFFSLVQEAAAERGCIFFCDAAEGYEFETEFLEGDDLSGWLIPISDADVFESEWKISKWETGQFSNNSWWDNYLIAKWSNNNGNVTIDFKRY